MGQNPRAPIASTFADDPALQEGIDAFVIALGERVDALQDAELADDWKQLDELAAALAADAQRLGYPVLAGISSLVREACATEDGEQAHAHLLDLTDIAQRIRLGHRSAA